MEFSIKSGSPEKQRSGCVVVGVFDGRKLSASAQAIDSASRSYLSDVLRRGDHDGKLGTTLLLHKVPQIAADRVLLVGLGREREFTENAYRTAVGAAVRALKATGA
jgi:leucyl aminopeptidase